MAFTVSNNSPSAGYIAWSGLNIQFAGVSYAIANGNTNKVYAYWTPSYPNNLVVSDSFPTLTANDCLVFLNKGGIATVVPTSTVLPGDLIVPGTILTNALAANCITTDKIMAGAVTAGSLATNSVSADKIAANAVGADKIAANAVTADKIVSGAVTTEKLAAGAVTANKIAANAVTAASIAANAIGAGAIAAGAIRADHISSAAVTADKINVSDLVASAAFIAALKAKGLEVVAGTSSVTIKIEDGRIKFIQGGEEVAYMAENKLHILSANILSEITIGAYTIGVASDNGIIFK